MISSKGVVRVDTRRTHAWQVRIDRWFGDVAWGGKKKALAAARAWRERAQHLLQVTETPGHGVSRHHTGRGWKARVTLVFSDGVHGGRRAAARSAAAWRAGAVAILSAQLPLRPPRSAIRKSNTGERGVSRTSKDGRPALIISVLGRRSSVSLRKWGRQGMGEARRRRDALDLETGRIERSRSAQNQNR